MSERTLEQALAHADGVRNYSIPDDMGSVIIERKILADVYNDFVLLADALRAEQRRHEDTLRSGEKTLTALRASQAELNRRSDILTAKHLECAELQAEVERLETELDSYKDLAS